MLAYQMRVLSRQAARRRAQIKKMDADMGRAEKSLIRALERLGKVERALADFELGR